MKFPPKLSRREREIVPYIVDGFTRKEIAQTLNVSEETVKVFYRSLARKFDAGRLREAMEDLAEYYKFFIKGPHKFYVPHVDTVFTLLADGTSDVIETRYSVVAISDTIREIKELYTTAGEMKRVTMNGRVIAPIVDVGKRFTYHYALQKKLARFETYDMHVVTEVVGAYGRENSEKFANGAYDPTGSMTLTVQFDTPRLPKRVICYRQHGNQEVSGEFPLEVLDERRYKISIQDPIYLSEYTIRWFWK